MFRAQKAILGIALATVAIMQTGVSAQENLGRLASDTAATIPVPQQATVRSQDRALIRGEREMLASEKDLPTPESREQKSSRSTMTEASVARQHPLASETSTPNQN